MDLTAVSILPWPEIITTDELIPSDLSRLSVSSPSMPVPSHISSKMQLKSSLRATSRHSSPDEQDSTVIPSSSSTPRSVSRIPGSSSTINTEFIIRNLSNCRQFDNELSTTRMICRHLYLSLVLADYSLNDRKTQTGPASLGRKIGLKQLLQVARQYPRTVVRDLDHDQIAGNLISSRNIDLAIL